MTGTIFHHSAMVDHLATVGLSKWEVDKAIKVKTTAYNQACREFKNQQDNNKKQAKPTSSRVTRKNSFQKQN